MYAVTFAGSALKDLEKLDDSLVKRIFPKIENLAGHPRPSGCLKLQGHNDFWRIRIGDYRVVYAVDDKKRVVDIVKVGHRQEVYSG